MNRRGTTLLELLVAVGLGSGVIMAGVAVLRAAAGAERRAAERLTSTRLTTTVGSLLRYELAERRPSDVTQSGSALLLPRRVGEGVPCAGAGAALVVADADWQGLRWPEAGRDEVWVVDRQGVRERASLLEWVGSACPDGRVGWRLLLDREVAEPGYLRVVEQSRLASYASGGRNWFGLAPVDGSATIQPFAGPLPPGCQPLRVVGTAVEVAPCLGVADTTTIAIHLGGS